MENKETIYIAGPEIFFENGDDHLAYMRSMSEARGHKVSLPNDTPLDLNNEDLRKNADNIFSNLEKIIYDTTMIISDLDLFRGGEADGGTIYEIGMAYALGLKSYGYTRDMRSLVWKDQKLTYDSGNVHDEHGNLHHYSFLPFSPMIMGTTKIVEGRFEDVLNAYETDVYFGHTQGLKHKQIKKYKENKVYVSLRNYYDQEEIEKTLSKLDTKDYEIVSPYFRDYKEDESISDWVDEILNENLKRVDECEYFIGDLNDYRGFEPSNDVSFLSGYAFQTGKKLYAFMDDTRRMIDKIPNKPQKSKFKDLAMRDVENFNYPINLMFGSSMEIVGGNLQDAINNLKENNSGSFIV